MRPKIHEKSFLHLHFQNRVVFIGSVRGGGSYKKRGLLHPLVPVALKPAFSLCQLGKRPGFVRSAVTVWYHLPGKRFDDVRRFPVLLHLVKIDLLPLLVLHLHKIAPTLSKNRPYSLLAQLFNLLFRNNHRFHTIPANEVQRLGRSAGITTNRANVLACTARLLRRLLCAVLRPSACAAPCACNCPA